MISPTFYADCKAKVAALTYEDLVRGCMAVRAVSTAYDRKYNQTPKRKASRMKWNRSDKAKEYRNRPEVKEKKKEYNREYEKTERCKAKHRRWNNTEAGRRSMRERSRRYAKAHPEMRRRNSNAYYARFKAVHGFTRSFYYTHKVKGDFLTEDIKSTKSNSTFSVQGTEQRAYLIVTGEAATKAKVMKEVDRIRTGGATFAEAKWTAKMLARTY